MPFKKGAGFALQANLISLDCHAIRPQDKNIAAYLPTLLFGVALLSVVGCGRSEQVTRSSANELIAHSPQFTPAVAKLHLTATELQCGINYGLWAKADRRHHSFESMFGFFQITPKGKTVLKSVSSSYSEPYTADAVLNKEYPRIVLQVTGIADYSPPLEGWTGREAQFTWHWRWDEFPDVVKQCISPSAPKKGTAVFRRYDDGWRVEQIFAD